ncbi:hypothetical protein EC161676_05044 [Escherichia coli O145:H28]|nr:hypothetical protein EC161676_05044 [Escherichia coli O145:H28]
MSACIRDEWRQLQEGFFLLGFQCAVGWLWRGQDQQQTCIFQSLCALRPAVFSSYVIQPEFRAIWYPAYICV